MVAQARKVGENRYRVSYGRCFEDFAPGAVYEHRPGLTITEADNTWFTAAHDDPAPAALRSRVPATPNSDSRP
jgi:acyl dehydratase